MRRDASMRQELREVSRQCLFAYQSCTMFPIDGLDRKTANDMRLRHHSCDASHPWIRSRCSLTELRPRASRTCYFRRGISANASHNVLVVDRNCYGQLRFSRYSSS